MCLTNGRRWPRPCVPGKLSPTAKAFAKAVELKPDIILLDIGLPKMDGFAVASKLRASGNCAGTLLVALAGYGQQEDQARSKEAGFDVHLVKTVDADTIRQLLCHPKVS